MKYHTLEKVTRNDEENALLNVIGNNNQAKKALKQGYVYYVNYYGSIYISTRIEDLTCQWSAFTTLKDAKNHALQHGNYTGNRLDAMSYTRSLTASDLIIEFMDWKKEGIKEYIKTLEGYINKSNKDWKKDKFLNDYKPYPLTIHEWKDQLKLEIKNLKKIEPKFLKVVSKIYPNK